METFRKRVFSEEEKRKGSQGHRLGDKIAWMMYGHPKIRRYRRYSSGFFRPPENGAQERQRADHPHKWDETIIAMQQQPDEELLVHFEKSDQFKKLVAKYTKEHGSRYQNCRVTSN